MRYELLAPYLNAAIRSSSMVGKFILVGALSRNSQLEVVANLNYLQSIVSFLIVVSGLEAYNVINRRLINNEGGNIASEILLSVIGYLLAFTSYVLFVEDELFPIWIALGILISDHLSQDMFRKLIFIQNQLRASLVLFVRSGLWAFTVTGLMLTDLYKFELISILYIWLFSSALSVLLAVKFLKKDRRIIQYLRSFAPGRAIADSIAIIRISYLYLVMATLSKFPYLADKFLIREWVDLKTVGIYAILSTIALGTFSVFESLIVSYKMPEILLHYRDKKRMDAIMKSYLFATLAIYIFAILMFRILLIDLEILGQDLNEYKVTLYILFSGIFTLSIGVGPQLYIYASSKDFAVNMLALIFPIIFGISLLLIPMLGAVASINVLPLCFLVSYGIQSLARFYFYFRLRSSVRIP